MATLEDSRHDFFLSNLPTTRDSALDLGCGSGLLVAALAPLFKRVVGIDISSEILEIASTKRSGSNIEYRQGDANQLQIDETFDLICSANTLHHVSNLPSVIEKLKNLLRPEGKLVVVDVISGNPTPPEWVYRVGSWLDFPKDLQKYGLANATRMFKFRNSRGWLNHLASDTYLSEQTFKSTYTGSLLNSLFPVPGRVVWQKPSVNMEG